MIGIVTPYKVVNYGTKLQAYAMQLLMNKYDDAELLGFIPGTDRRVSSVLGKIYLKIKKKSKNTNLHNRENIVKREKAINSFDENYKFGKIVKGNSAFNKEIKKYNAIVCGSDQLWAPSNVIADYFTLTLIPEEINKFSYAASFGINEVPRFLKPRYKRFLSRLNSISVREEQGGKIVKEVAGRDVTVVLDPTLMLDKKEWGNMAEKSKINIDEPYVFCYFLGTAPEHRAFAKKLAISQGLKLVSIPHFKGWNKSDEDFGDIQIYEAGPIEFLRLIQKARFVCTDSFHGTIFSIIFNRQVAVFERFRKNSSESTNSRIYTLLDSLGINGVLCFNENEVERFTNQKIQYNLVNSRLDVLKNRSYIYLDTALGKKRKQDD